MKRLNMTWIVLALAACASERPALRPEPPAAAVDIASVSTEGPLTAVRAVQIALAGHPEVRAELARLDAIEAERVQAGLWRNPMLGLMALRPESGGRLAIEAGWMQSLFDLFTRPRRQARADAEARRARSEVAMRLLEFGYAAQSAFYDAVAAAARVRWLQAELALDDEALSLQMRWTQRGLGSRSALLDLQLMRDERVHRLHEAESDATRARSMLAERLGLASAQSLVLPEEIEPVDAATLALAAAQSRALAQRPDVAASGAAIEAIDQERAIETGRWRLAEPELGLRLERDAAGMAMVGPDLRIALPWFDRGQARDARFDALSREAVARDEALRRRVVLEVERALALLAHAVQASEIAERHRARAVEAEVLSERLYRHGGSDRMAHIAARRALIEAERQRLDARAALAAAQIELQRALGGGGG